MNYITNAIRELRARAATYEKLAVALTHLNRFADANTRAPKKRRYISPEGRARIALAQRARWAKVRQAKKARA